MKKKSERARLSDDNLTVAYDKEEFSSTLPHLTKELLDPINAGRIEISSIEIESKQPEDPNAEHFLRRAKNEMEAEEVIAFLQKRNEISNQKADYYREKLRKEGLDSFGERIELGYYEKTFRRIKNEERI